MDKKSFISTKSIPSFTIFLPIISLLSITLFVLLMITNIKNELIEKEKHSFHESYDSSIQRLLKSRVDQAVTQIETILELEHSNHTQNMLSLLDDEILHYKKNSHRAQKTHLHAKKENDALYRVRIFDKGVALSQVCQALGIDNCPQTVPKQGGCISPGGKHKFHAKRHCVYAKEFDSRYFTVALNLKKFLTKHASEILKILEKVRFDKGEHFFIHRLDGTVLLNPDNKQSVGSNYFNISDKNGVKVHQQLLQDSGQGVYVQALSQKTGTDIYSEKLYYGRIYPSLGWIIATGVFHDEIITATQKIQEKKQLYFESKIREMLIIIVIVSTIILLLSLIIAKIINRIFSKFKSHIEEQNQALRNFNKELTDKVAQKTKELQRSESRYRTIFERSKDAVFILEEGKVSYCNETTLKMFGIHLKSSILGMPMTQFFPTYQPDGNHTERLFNDYLTITTTLGHSRFEWLAKKTDGRTFYVDIWLQSIELEGKKSIHVVLRDIDFQKKAQEKIKEQHKELMALNESLEERVDAEVQKNHEKEQLLLHQSRLAQMGEMISMIAHQWRQPLSAISTSSANLKLQIELDQYNSENFKQGLDNVDNYVQHLSQTINDFRNFFRPDNEQEECSLADLIERSIEIIKKSFENNEITVTIKQHKDITLYTYPHEIMQVVLNILKNAEDIFIEREIKPAELIIETREDDDNYIVAFEDNAGGIDEEIIEKIFDPYFSTKNKKNGTGLGLYMSKVIISEHCHGTLTADNTEAGARFTMTLPKQFNTKI